MKPATAATILRSMRSRAEISKGIVQMGEYEMYAIAIALAATESDLTPEGANIEAGDMSFSVLKVNQPWFELIRTAYKMLDEMSPSTDFQISKTTLDAVFSGKKAKKDKKEKKMKPLSLSPADVEWFEKTISAIPANASDIKDDQPQEKKGDAEDPGDTGDTTTAS